MKLFYQIKSFIKNFIKDFFIQLLTSILIDPQTNLFSKLL